MVQCVAVCCSVFSVLQCAVVQCIFAVSAVCCRVCCNVLQRVIVSCIFSSTPLFTPSPVFVRAQAQISQHLLQYKHASVHVAV